MYKDEMIQLHQFLVYVLKYLDTDNSAHEFFDDYLALNISPHHIHRTKAEHKHAIFVLSNIISEVILNKEEGSVPPNVSNALRDLVRRSKKELKAAEEKGNKLIENAKNEGLECLAVYIDQNTATIEQYAICVAVFESYFGITE